MGTVNTRHPNNHHNTMDSLAGATLIKADGTTAAAEAVLGDKEIILFYFSAHWCPPCRQFTPMLKDFFEELPDTAGVQIVFVSSDRSEADMLSYMKDSHGEWFATQHNSSVANGIKSKFGISGIPTLVVVKKDGTLITKDGRSYVTSLGPEKALKEWRK